eukprot:augustus_masked-scaffold_5-processed-gene-19.48-mRNA-1 protein AED:0.41 eAED:0.42 QI:0/-1/0/1/-1/1/1/0/354
MKFIVKPASAQGGKNIYLATGMEIYEKRAELLAEDFVIQEYLENPLLIDGKKFDLRVHVVLTSVKPLRLYFHPNAFVRFAATEYNEVNRSSFLTNLAINYKIKPTDELTFKLKEFLLFLTQGKFRHNLEEGIEFDAKKLLRKLETTITFTLLATEPGFIKVLGDLNCFGCYQTLGLDIIFDNRLNPRVIEVNGNPTLDFTAPKLNYDARRFQHGLVKLLYPTRTDKYNYSHGNNVYKQFLYVSPREDSFRNFKLGSGISYYLKSLEQENRNIMLKKLSLAQLYPAVVPDAEKKLWTEFLASWNTGDERKELHNVLALREMKRASGCASLLLEQVNEFSCRTDIMLLKKLGYLNV